MHNCMDGGLAAPRPPGDFFLSKPTGDTSVPCVTGWEEGHSQAAPGALVRWPPGQAGPGTSPHAWNSQATELNGNQLARPLPQPHGRLNVLGSNQMTQSRWLASPSAWVAVSHLFSGRPWSVSQSESIQHSTPCPSLPSWGAAKDREDTWLAVVNTTFLSPARFGTQLLSASLPIFTTSPRPLEEGQGVTWIAS